MNTLPGSWNPIGGPITASTQPLTIMISRNGEYALQLRPGGYAVISRRNKTTGVISTSDIIWSTQSNSPNTTPTNINDARFGFNPDSGAIYIDYQDSTRNNSWIRLFEQTNSGINHNNYADYNSAYTLGLADDGALNIKKSSGDIVWSSTGTSIYGKSFHVMPSMEYVQAGSWTVLPHPTNFSQSIQTLMSTVNGDSSKLGFTVKYIEGGWKYKYITAAGNIIPSWGSHTYLKITLDSAGKIPYRTYYREEGSVTNFDFINGLNLDATAIEYTTNIAETKSCAIKSVNNGLSRGFVYNPITKDCYTVGDTNNRTYATASLPIPTGGNDGYESGWKKPQTSMNTLYGGGYAYQLKSNQNNYYFKCEDNGELKLTNSAGTILWSNHVYCWQGCKMYVENWNGGRVVVYDKDNLARWVSNEDSGTNNQARMLEVGDDGIVRLKTVNGGAVLWDTQNWSTNRVEINSDLNQYYNYFSDPLNGNCMRNGNWRVWLQGDGKLVVGSADKSTIKWTSPWVGNDSYRAVLGTNEVIVETTSASPIWKWCSSRGGSYYPAGLRTLYLHTNGILKMYHGGNLVWSSEEWAPKELHVSRGKLTGSKWFRIQAVYLSGTTTVSQSNQCLAVPGTPADHAAVYFYSDTTQLTDQANWKLYPVLDDAGSDGEYYIVLASNTAYGLHRWNNNDNDVCLRILSQDMGNNSRWRISWDSDLNGQTCRIRPRDNLSKALYWTNSNVNGTRAYIASGAGATSGILNLSW
jgi:hypothetical protein